MIVLTRLGRSCAPGLMHVKDFLSRSTSVAKMESSGENLTLGSQGGISLRPVADISAVPRLGMRICPCWTD